MRRNYICSLPGHVYDFSNLTNTQIERLGYKIWRRIHYYGGTTNWDWSTLIGVFPEYARILSMLFAEIQRR